MTHISYSQSPNGIEGQNITRTLIRVNNVPTQSANLYTFHRIYPSTSPINNIYSTKYQISIQALILPLTTEQKKYLWAKI
ncbi:hypothetical protein [Tenacibaculum sp. UWU-22]|uniref:hypothetical protein n=1 Tax=Tenacibaculum sp. UWU-22 TaxID=3234187 RepID=UPI0034DB5CAC